MKPELRAKVIAFNKARAADAEKASDLLALLGAPPPGQVKQLLKDEACASILTKYGIAGVGDEST